MLKTIKNQKNLFLFTKIILFLGVIYILYGQISRIEPVMWDSFQLENPLFMVLAIILVMPNIWIAFLKWKLTLRTIGVPSNSQSRIQSFFAGVVTGMLTPNMLGNFIGRFYYFDKEYRSQIITFTMLSNFGQFIASFSFGTIAVFLLDELLIFEESKNILILLLVGFVLAYLLYFFVDNLLALFKRHEFTKRFNSILKADRAYRIKLLLLSYGRFAIFTLQFSLMLAAFGEEWNLTLLASIWQVYLITMIAPSLFLGKIGVKESIALFVLSGLGMNDFAILFSSLIIWFVNSLSPALLGFAVCRNRDWT